MESLNPLGQTMQCGVEGKEYVCVERVAAARAGIEDLYLQETGLRKYGIALGQMYEAGDELSTLLYETSVLALSHATLGVMKRYAFSESETSVAVFHGGNCEIGKYRATLKRNLMRLPRFQSQVIFSRNLSANVCLDGAAIMAVYDDN